MACCQEFSLHADGQQNWNPFEIEEDGTWNIPGCCGGGCYVVVGVKFCPFCGSKVSIEKTAQTAVEPAD